MPQKRQPLLYGRNLIIARAGTAIGIIGFFLLVLGHGDLILVGAFLVLVTALSNLWVGIQLRHEIKRRKAITPNQGH
jgi:hypothetical protein